MSLDVKLNYSSLCYDSNAIFPYQNSSNNTMIYAYFYYRLIN